MIPLNCHSVLLLLLAWKLMPLGLLLLLMPCKMDGQTFCENYSPKKAEQ
jgi:hypothetical protein